MSRPVVTAQAIRRLGARVPRDEGQRARLAQLDSLLVPQPMIPSEPGLDVSLSTLLGVAPLLGGPLEDRRTIPDRQDAAIVAHALQDSRREVTSAAPQGFCVAPMDFWVTGPPDAPLVRLIELNGSGMGGSRTCRWL